MTRERNPLETIPPMPPTANDDDSGLPPRPRLVLRIGFAGKRNLTADDEARLGRALDRVFGSIARRLMAVQPDDPPADSACGITGFYDPTRPPLLRLVTGLCEGADTAAVLALERLDTAGGGAPDAAGRPGAAGLETTLAAVLPFDIQSYRSSRYGWFLAEFDRQAGLCEYIVELDGIHDLPQPDTDLAQVRRQKGYRAQSAVLLRQADLLLAAADPHEPGKAGGTLETVHAALDFELPVIFIDTGDASVRLLDPGDDPVSVLALPPPTDADLDRGIDALVTRLVADPDPDAGCAADGGAGLALLREVFDGGKVPPTPAALRGMDRWRLASWRWLKKRLGRGGTAASAAATGDAGDADDAAETPFDETHSPYHRWRDRARRLNRHYDGLYRGAFVLAYGLAVAAVLLAGLGLVLLGEQSDNAMLLSRIMSNASQMAASAGSDAATAAAWLIPALLLLGLGNLVIVRLLARNTEPANDGHWCDLAVNYRYLAERLRALYYLPLTGSFQPPAAAPARAASRVANQSRVDWLCGAITRAVSPARFAEVAFVPAWDGSGHLDVRVVRPRPRRALALIQEHWVRGQSAHHARNARLMGRLDQFTARAARRLSTAVVAVVLLDLLLVAWGAVGTMPASAIQPAHLAAPWLMFLAALLPAAVASLNGLRFQSECQRRAERSLHLHRVLGGRRRQIAELAARMDAAAARPDDDIGAWTLDALRAGERVAGDCVLEVADWSVLYAKELPET